MRRAGSALLTIALLLAGGPACSAAASPFPVSAKALPGDNMLRVSNDALEWNGQHIDPATLDAYIIEQTYRFTGTRLVLDFPPDTSPARRRAVLAHLGRTELCRKGLCVVAAGEPSPSVALASLPKGGAIIKGIAYGPAHTLSCRWFSNFENSRFEQCWAQTGGPLIKADEGASLECPGTACAGLDRQARAAAHWKKPEPPWGTFTVRLIGRVSLYQHRPHYLGDGTSTVLVEKLLGVAKAN